ncbi:MAG: Gfo/Idh/MocA family protein, partial [Candidatus Zipacnadales bacterium]
MAEPLRAVVLGASGVGRHHVKWLMRAGCKVVGFLGTTPGSVAKTTEMLRETLGFQGRGYTSLSELIGDCRPQLASVCSPMSVHYEHVMACLGAGAHVLCEKPLVGGETCTADTLLFLGERLVRTAENMNRLFAVNTQYAAVAPHLQASCEAQGVAPQPVTQFFMQMESRGHGGIREYETIWHDLAAHPISVLLALVPDGQVDWSTVNCIAERQQIRCTFDFAPPSGQVCRASILLRHVPEG